MVLSTIVRSPVLRMAPAPEPTSRLSVMLAPVIVSLGQQNGLIVPLIAVHLFVFYFGIMADVTPPVGLASFAAAAVSGGDAIKTGFTAFFYSLRTVGGFKTALYEVEMGVDRGRKTKGKLKSAAKRVAI